MASWDQRGRRLDAACQAVRKQSELVKAILAKRIIEAARNGERNGGLWLRGSALKRNRFGGVGIGFLKVCRVMGEKSREYRAQARQLEERAKIVTNESARSALIATAQLWRQIAREVERCERGGLNVNAAVAALSRAVSVYGKLEDAQPIPEYLEKLAAEADEVFRQRLTSSTSI